MCFYLSQLQYSKPTDVIHSILQQPQDTCLYEFAQSVLPVDVAALFSTCYLPLYADSVH